MTANEDRDDNSKYEFVYSEDFHVFSTKKVLSRETIEEMSKSRGEPYWMGECRLRSYDTFMSKPTANWGCDLSKIDVNKIYYHATTSKKEGKKSDDFPESIGDISSTLGTTKTGRRKFLARMAMQHESEAVYRNLRENLEKEGVIFVNIDTAVKDYPELIEKYFGMVIPPDDNKFAALNSAIWSGGSFIYLPPNKKIKVPIHADYKTIAQNSGQFERNLIIADEGAELHYVEGCTPPVHASSTESLHFAITELIATKCAKIRYTSIQNWSKNVYNLVTKRAYAYEDATVEWIDGNIGGRLTMKYPSVYMLGRNAHAELVSFAFAGSGQLQDVGAKAVHLGENTTSKITSKSISKSSGRTIHRGLIHVGNGAIGAKADVRCDALILDENSRIDIYPSFKVNEKDAMVIYEGAAGGVGVNQIFYLMSRGYTVSDALSMVLEGFIEPFIKELPLEYAVELDRFLKLETEHSPFNYPANLT
jgi:Fe-S cluster assembly protein SufB